jgi:hypothetical protein
LEREGLMTMNLAKNRGGCSSLGRGEEKRVAGLGR